MSLKAKSYWRIAILAAAVSVVVGSAGGFYAYRRAEIKRNEAALRTDGMAAFAAGDFETALAKLRPYLLNHQSDIEAVAAYADARLEVTAPQRRHLVEAIAVIRHLLKLDPSRTEARRKLLDLYEQVGYLTETVDLADQLLATSPGDPGILAGKARALEALRKYDDALTTAQLWLKATPSDIEAQVTTIRLLDATRRPDQELLSAAEEMVKAAPSEYQAAMVQGVAYRLTDLLEQSRLHLIKAAERPAPDSKLDPLLVTELEMAGLYDRALALTRVLAEGGDPVYVAQLARRLWERERFGEVISLLADVTPESKEDDVSLKPLKAWALATTGDVEGAKAIHAALAKQQGDSHAAAWTALLSNDKLGEPVPARARVRLIEQAARDYPRDAVLANELGDAYYDLSERALAGRYWTFAARRSPSWSAPVMRLSALALERGDQGKALGLAIAAGQRDPSNVAAGVLLAKTISATLDAPSGTDVPMARQDRIALLNEMITKVQEIAPGEPTTLGIRASLMGAKGDPEAAAAAIRAALAAEARPTQATYGNLIALSRRMNLGMEQEIIDAAQKTMGLTPELALFHASELSDEKSPQAGLIFLQDAALRAPAEQAIDWQLATARYMELARLPEAPEHWKRLCEGHPDNADVQQQALSAPSVQQDLELFEKTIERVRALTGEEGLTWRLAKAKLLYGKNDRGSDDEAIKLLQEFVRAVPDSAEARYLLALGLDRVGNTIAAVEQLTLALDVDPMNYQALTEMVRLLHARSDYARAAEYVDRLARLAPTDREQLRLSAMLMARQGRLQEAVDRLVQFDQGKEPDLLLASLYRQLGDNVKTREVVTALMTKPDLPIIQFAADFYGSQGNLKAAQEALDAIAGLKVEPGEAELVQAQFNARYVGVESALEAAQRSTAVNPKLMPAWRTLISLQVAVGDTAGATASLKQARAAIPEEPTFAEVEKRWPVLSARIEEPELRSLINAVIQNPVGAKIEWEALSMIADAGELAEDPRLTNMRLRQLADRNIDSLPLGMAMVQRYLSVEDYDDAGTVGMRLLDLPSQSPEPVRLAYEALSRADRWTEALNAAVEWRKRSGADTIDADMAVAEARLKLNQSKVALDQLTPQLNRVLSDPARYQLFVTNYARVLIQNGLTEQADALLWPLANRDEIWRRTWIELASQLLDNEAASAWLERVKPLIPPDDIDGRMVLATGHDALNNRFPNTGHRAAADAVYAELLAREDLPPFFVTMIAMVYERNGDIATAEASYRRVLAAGDSGDQAGGLPPSLLAANNMAVILSSRKEALDEALTLAKSAVASNPRIGALHDTLATVHMARGEQQEALKAITEAVKREPVSLPYRVHMAEILSAVGRRDDARRVLGDIDTITAHRTIEETMRRRVENLRQTMAQVE